jgi:hypothetical protein
LCKKIKEYFILSWIKNNKLMMLCCMITLAIMGCMFKKTESSGTVIILNGTSAVGKSSIMRAFHAQHVGPWLGIGIDNFVCYNNNKVTS